MNYDVWCVLKLILVFCVCVLTFMGVLSTLSAINKHYGNQIANFVVVISSAVVTAYTVCGALL